jgi:hypothetical protein
MQRRACSDDTQGAACKRPVQQTTDGMHHTGKMQPTPRSVQHTTSRHHAPCSGQYAANDLKRATRNMQHAPGFMQNTATNKRHATQQIPCNRLRATCSMQQTTYNVEKTSDGVQRTTRNKATDTTQHAACSRRQTSRSKQQTNGNAQRAACNRQRATDSRQHARGREHMRDATGSTQHCRTLSAASSGRHTPSSMREALYETTSAQLGTDAAHKMQHHHTSCAAAGSRPCNARDETNEMLWLTSPP